MSMQRFVPALMLLGAVASMAQQPPAIHDEVVVTATGDPVAADEVPAAATVLTADDLRALDLATVADALQFVPGALLLRSGLEGGVASLFVRGTGSDQTLVLFDGVRLNSPFFGGYDWSVPLSLGVGQIEIVRGPYSALYGADALGGVVQLIPASADRTGVHVLTEGGSQGWRRAELEATLRSGGWELLADAGSRAGSGTLSNDDFWSRAAMVEARTGVGESGQVGVLFRRTTSHTDIPFSGALLTPRRYTAAAENLLAVPLHIRLGTGVFEFTLSRVERDLRYRDPDDPSGFVASDTAADSDGARAAYHVRWGRHRLTVGGEWRRDTVTDGSNFGLNLDGVHLTTWSWFAEDQLALAPAWKLLAGLRSDDAQPWGRELSPRVTLAWFGGGARGWLCYGRAFRAPALGELYYPFSGNPNLRPERSGSLEVGVAFPAPARLGVLQLVGFSNRESQLIDFDAATFRFVNVARALQDGVEASWLATVGGGRIEASLTWLDARDGAGAALLRRPAWSGSVALTHHVGEGWELAASLTWAGPRADEDPVSLARVHQGGFAVASATARAPLTSLLSARLRIDNLADRRYEAVRGYPAPGRRVMLGLEAQWR
jgi:vitamin B12 transporter